MEKEEIYINLIKEFGESVETSSKEFTKLNTDYDNLPATSLIYPRWISELDSYHYSRERNPDAAYKNGPWVIGISIEDTKDKLDKEPYFECRIFGLRGVEETGHLSLKKNHEDLSLRIIKNISGGSYERLDAWIKRMRLKSNQNNLVFKVLKDNYYEPVLGFEICRGEYWHAKGQNNRRKLINSLLEEELKNYTKRMCELIKTS